MADLLNPIPALNSEYLAKAQHDRHQLIELRNEFVRRALEEYPTQKKSPRFVQDVESGAYLVQKQAEVTSVQKWMREQADEVYKAVASVLTDERLQEIASHRVVLRPTLEQVLFENVENDSFPRWLESHHVTGRTPIKYMVTVEGRSRKGIGKSARKQYAGFVKVEIPITVMRSDDVKDLMKHIVIDDYRSDHPALNSELEEMLKAANGLRDEEVDVLSIVHSFIPVKAAGGSLRNVLYDSALFLSQSGAFSPDFLKRMKVKSLGELASKIESETTPLEDMARVDARIKSGAENVWKETEWYSGWNRPGKEPRRAINDYLAQRFRGPEDTFQKDAVSFLVRYSSDYPMDYEKMIALQNWPVGDFLEHVSSRRRNFFERASVEEHRAPIKKGKRELYPRYITAELPTHPKASSAHIPTDYNKDLVTPFSDVLHRNEQEVHLISNSTYAGIENVRDHLGYKAASDARRVEEWSLFEWAVAARLAETFDPQVTDHLSFLLSHRPAESFVRRLSPIRYDLSSSI